MYFRLSIDPPRTTAQQKGVSSRDGKLKFYTKSKVRAAENLFLWHLVRLAPAEPFSGPVMLKTVWTYQAGKTHKDGSYKATRPDTDNLLKLFKDCMTKAGFWKDDSQVCYEITVKRWGHDPGIEVIVADLSDFDPPDLVDSEKI